MNSDFYKNQSLSEACAWITVASFIVFWFSLLSPTYFVGTIISLIAFVLSLFIGISAITSLHNQYKEAYDIFLTGDEEEIMKIDKAVLNATLRHYAKVNEYEYSTQKIKHPTFQEYRDIKVFAFPIAIELNFKLIDNELKKENFQLSREVVYSTGSKKLESLIIDDVNKRFAVINGKIIDIVPFTDLKSCEIFNSSNAIQTSAKPMSYTTEVHTSVIINLKNNLQKPNININFIDLHKKLFPNAAYDIKGALDYILEQNNNIQN